MLEHRLPASRTATWAAVTELTPMILKMTRPLVAVALTICNSIAGNGPHMYTRLKMQLPTQHRWKTTVLAIGTASATSQWQAKTCLGV